MSDQISDLRADETELRNAVQDIQAQLAQRKLNSGDVEREEYNRWKGKTIHALNCKIKQLQETRQKIRELQGPGPDKPTNWWRVYCSAITGLCATEMSPAHIVQEATKIADTTMLLGG